jgi:hypothetical protein
LFRSRLANNGWAVRGAAKQPNQPKGFADLLTGDVNDEQPDARSLFLAGGVEIAEVSVPASADFQLNPLAKSWVFIRSPADVFFYSGHGLWTDCTLVVDLGPSAAYEGRDAYFDWLTPEVLLDSWNERSHLVNPVKVLIINGCGVLGHFGDSDPAGDQPDHPMSPCALRWRDLLKSQGKGGSLKAILGYRGTAPLDEAGGNQIAQEMAQAMIGLGDDWDKYAQIWMEINHRHPLGGTAAAMDDQGNYWFLNRMSRIA